ncbi:MAG: methylenetetrahydrofolate reductase [Halobacteriota archaeon]
MSLGKRSTPTTEDLSAILAEPRFELMPFESFETEIEFLPDNAQIAITTSPQLGLGATLDRTEQAIEQGFEVIPHIAARYVRDDAHLETIARRLTAAGVTDIFVPGGDREEPVGEFDSAYSLLSTLEEMEYSFDEVGITGYPEGHAFIDDETLADAMEQKAPYATYIVTQLCYDPVVVLEWIERIRDRGVDLPIEVGIPGVMKYQRLLKISQKVGVGDSVRFLRKTTGIVGFVRELIGSKGTYTPDNLIEGLAPHVGDKRYNIRGVHIYTFNETADTETWRRETLDSL